MQGVREALVTNPTAVAADWAAATHSAVIDLALALIEEDHGPTAALYVGSGRMALDFGLYMLTKKIRVAPAKR